MRTGASPHHDHIPRFVSQANIQAQAIRFLRSSWSSEYIYAYLVVQSLRGATLWPRSCIKAQWVSSFDWFLIVWMRGPLRGCSANLSTASVQLKQTTAWSLARLAQAKNGFHTRFLPLYIFLQILIIIIYNSQSASDAGLLSKGPLFNISYSLHLTQHHY